MIYSFKKVVFGSVYNNIFINIFLEYLHLLQSSYIFKLIDVCLSLYSSIFNILIGTNPNSLSSPSSNFTSIVKFFPLNLCSNIMPLCVKAVQPTHCLPLIKGHCVHIAKLKLNPFLLLFIHCCIFNTSDKVLCPQ